MGTIKEITLHWNGPFCYAKNDDPNLIPPEKPGLYLWTVNISNVNFIIYVGESGNLRKRFYDHMIYLLGGGYRLYDISKLKEEKILCSVYDSQYSTLNSHFINSYSKLSKIAYDNISSYQIFWVYYESANSERKKIESGIINTLKGLNNSNSRLLENDRCSIKSDPDDMIKVNSIFPEGLRVSGLENTFDY